MFEQKLTIQYFGGLADPQITKGKLDCVEAVKFSREDWEIIGSHIKKRAGLYLLMTEPIFHPATTTLYIGESVNVRMRMNQHVNERNWLFAIVVVDKEGDLEEDDVLYLESVLIDKSIALGYKLINKQKPHRKGTAKADEFLKDMGRHVCALNGPNFFEISQKNERLEVCRPITTNPVLKPDQYKAIVKWLETTDEELICVRMICDRVLHLSRKPSRRISNAVMELLKQQTDAWVKHPNKNGQARCGKYGKQVCFLRKTTRDGLW